MNRYSRLGKNTLFVFIGNVGGKGLTFLMLPLYTKWLSPSDFGTVDILFTYASLLFGLVTLSISEAVFLFPKDKPFNEQRKYFSSGLLFTIFSFIIIGAIVSLYIQLSGSKSHYVFYKYLWIIYLLIFSMFLHGYFQQFTRCIDKMSVYSMSGLILSVLIIVNSFLFIPHYKIYGYLFSWSVSYFFAACYCLYTSRAFRYLSFKELNVKYYKEMLSYSIPLIPNAIMFWLVNSLNRPLMEQYLGLDAVGIYAVACKFPLVLSTLFNVFLLSWHITVLEEYGKSGYESFFNKMLRYAVFASGVIFFLISIFSRFVIKIIASAEFYAAWQYVSLLTLGSLMLSLSAFIGGNFLATKKSKYFLYSSTIGAGFSLCLNFLLIPLYGIYGAVISVLIAYMFMLFIRAYYISKCIQLYHIGKYIMMVVLFISFSIITNLDDSIYKSLLVMIEIAVFLYLNRDMKKDYYWAYQKINYLRKKK